MYLYRHVWQAGPSTVAGSEPSTRSEAEGLGSSIKIGGSNVMNSIRVRCKSGYGYIELMSTKGGISPRV